MSKVYKVVIVGGGFAGIKTALELANNQNFDITLISNKSHFQYHAALYRTATGRSPKEVVLPINHLVKHAKNVYFAMDQIVKIARDEQCVSGESGAVYSYDFLVFATGLVANYYGIKGLEESSFSLDSVSNTIELRKHLHDMVIKNTKKSYSFVVVGAGASGTELSAELASYIATIAKTHNVKHRDVHVTLIEGAPRVLPLLRESVSRRALKKLQKRGVRVELNKQVTEYTDGILTYSGNKLGTETLVWTAGLKNNPFFSKYPDIFPLAKNGRVEVDNFLSVQENIFVIGDNAATKYSGMAQTALFDAQFIAHNLKRIVRGQPARKYQPKRPIYAVPIGGKNAVIQWGIVSFAGYFGWVLRRIADFRLFHEFEPLREAVKTWRAGNRKARMMACESCDPKHES